MHPSLVTETPRFVQLIFTLVLCLSTLSDALAQSTAISGTPASGNVAADYAVTPNGLDVVFIADRSNLGRNELYSVRLLTGVISKLSISADVGREVTSFKIAPDGSRVVYRGDLSPDVGSDDRFELYSVPISGGASAVLTVGADGTTTNTNRDVEFDYQISPDSSRVVFRADLQTDNTIELFSAPIAGGVNVKLASASFAAGDVFGFQISPSSAQVVAYGDLTTDQVFELYGVSIAGGSLQTISGATIATNGDVFDFQISPDSTKVVFRGDVETDNKMELFVAPLAPGNRIKISGDITPPGGNVQDFQISPNGVRVVFRGDLLVDEKFELFSVPMAGGGRVELSGAVVADGDVSSGYRISPDSSYAVFIGGLSTASIKQLYLTPITGGTRTAYSPETVDRSVWDFAISPDSKTLVFTSGPSFAQLDLASKSVAGGLTYLLSGTIVSGGTIESFRISPDGSRVVFAGDLINDGESELFSMPIKGGARARLSGGNAIDGDVYDFQISPDSARAIFRGDVRTDAVVELFRVPIDGVALALDFDGDDRVLASTDLLMLTRYLRGMRGSALTESALAPTATISSPTDIAASIVASLSANAGRIEPVRVSDPIAGSSHSVTFSISPDSRYLVYTMKNGSDPRIELLAVHLASGTTVDLRGSAVAGGNGVWWFRISPDSTRVVFAAELETSGVLELYSAPIAGGTRTKLSSTPINAVSCGDPDFAMSADSARVVFTQPLENSGACNLFSAPIAGGSRAQLTNNTDPQRFIGEIQVSPNSAHVVYSADFENLDRYDIYRAPIGGGSSTKISGQNNGGDASYFLLSPNGAYVVFRGDLNVTGRFELYSVPLLGGNRVTLSVTDAGNTDGDVDSFAITPDSTRVVYLGDLKTDAVRELFSAPIAGGSQTLLSHNVGAQVGQNVESFLISPNSGFVVFRGDLRVNNRYELYRVATTGPGAAPNSAALVNNTYVTNFRIAPDSTRVVFIGSPPLLIQNELFSISISGQNLTALSGTLEVNAPGVYDFEISPDGQHVVFAAVVNNSLTQDLFSAPIAGGDRVLLGNSEEQIEKFEISRDATRVVFLSRAFFGERELLMAPTDGVFKLLDFDGDNQVLPQTDLLLLTRYRLGFRGAALTRGVQSLGAFATQSEWIESRIEAALAAALQR